MAFGSGFQAIEVLLLVLASTTAFTTQPNCLHRKRLRPLASSTQPPSDSDESVAVVGVVAPLKYVGPYATIQLEFPQHDGASINFVLDTGANVNSISKDLAKELDLPVVVRKEDLSLLGSAGAGGSFSAGDFVMLGDCELGGMPEGYPRTTFMTNLTAASLDLGIARSVGGGMLGASFFTSFTAGFEFDWHGTHGDPPTVICYYGKDLPEDAKDNAFRVPLEESFFGVPSTTVNINGVDLRAIIDTGSPITVVSPDVAEEVGLGTESALKIKGIDNKVVDLRQSLKGASISIGKMALGNVPTVCVGSLPGLSIASGLSSAPEPQVLLGLDTLRRTYRTILRLPNEVWFEEMPKL